MKHVYYDFETIIVAARIWKYQQTFNSPSNFISISDTDNKQCASNALQITEKPIKITRVY